MHSQFARAGKGVDLRSTGGNSAWVIPQLTSVLSYSHWRSAGVIRKDKNEGGRRMQGDDGDVNGVDIGDDDYDCCGDHEFGNRLRLATKRANNCFTVHVA